MPLVCHSASTTLTLDNALDTLFCRDAEGEEAPKGSFDRGRRSPLFQHYDARCDHRAQQGRVLAILAKINPYAARAVK